MYGVIKMETNTNLPEGHGQVTLHHPDLQQNVQSLEDVMLHSVIFSRQQPQQVKCFLEDVRHACVLLLVQAAQVG